MSSNTDYAGHLPGSVSAEYDNVSNYVDLQWSNTLLRQLLTNLCFQDYIFSLLTGYVDAPAGVTMQEGQYYNPYFPGQAIGMAQALYNEIIEYEDGDFFFVRVSSLVFTTVSFVV